MPGTSEYSANRVLSGFAQRYKNRAYIAEQVSPVYDVDATTNAYYSFGETEEFDEYETEINGDEGSVTESKGERALQTFKTVDYSHAEHIPRTVEQEGDIIGFPEIDLATERVTGVVKRKEDIGCAARLFDAANYPTGYKLTVTNHWGTCTVKQLQDMINDAIDAMIAKGEDKMQMVIGRVAWRALSTNTNLIANVVPTKAASQLTKEQIAELLGIDEIVIGEAQKTRKGSTTKSFIWGDFACLHIITPKPSLLATGHVVTFRKKVFGQPISTYVIPTSRGAHNGTLLKVSMTEKTAHIVNNQAGYLFSSVSA